ncbi:hypothetical protein PSMK_07200 [Phycisphaera mikurensis NBRC 102666]|uniref:Sialidase domain-containing protein n=1 Tax=Phycisphaera mikurensis (strain NBRC 102666 / KCTC 22515 / FYK2301M01) TaxID=1142394 RepID=I0IC91_PHYMF|nr:hypothetical protein PSMK_07200 [Phycisphaera mikurensis NBRC 102666]
MLAAAALAAVFPLGGCGPAAGGTRPAPAASLAVVADGGVLHRLVGHANADGKTMSLAYDRSADGGAAWSPPVAVKGDPAGPPIKKVSRGEDAAIAAAGDTLLAVWPGRGTGVWGSGPLGSAVSRDGGRTWSPAGDPAPFPADDPAGAHGARFPALQASPGGGFTLVWIDASDDARSMRSARFDPDASSWSEPVVVDAAGCACCWNALAAVGGAEVFVYRDVEPSDMAAARTFDGGRTWSDGSPVARFGWASDGCPHVGAGLAAEPDGGRLFAAVWTGQDGAAGLYRAFSDDAGESWSPPVRLGGDGATHPRMAALGGGVVAAAWTRHAAEGTTLVAAISTDRGETWSEPAAFAGGGPDLPSHVLLAAVGGRLTAHWTEAAGEAPAAVRSAVLPLPR